MKNLLILVLAAFTVGCATLTEDAMTSVTLTFSDGSNGKCNLSNKRGAWIAEIPAATLVRKSDDALKYDCQTEDGRKAFGSIESEMGGKIIASAIFLDFGIVDAITDKHRRYASSFVIPIRKVANSAINNSSQSQANTPQANTPQTDTSQVDTAQADPMAQK